MQKFCEECGRSYGVLLTLCGRCEVGIRHLAPQLTAPQKVLFCSEQCKMRAFATHHRKTCRATFRSMMTDNFNDSGAPSLRWKVASVGPSDALVPRPRPVSAIERLERTKMACGRPMMHV